VTSALWRLPASAHALSDYKHSQCLSS